MTHTTKLGQSGARRMPRIRIVWIVVVGWNVIGRLWSDSIPHPALALTDSRSRFWDAAGTVFAGVGGVALMVLGIYSIYYIRKLSSAPAE